MAQNFWTAIWAWSVCFAVTIAVSLATRAPDPARLAGLVYSATPRTADEGRARRISPVALGAAILAVTVALNVVFR
jgi:SSS family solute:Na+ symporter